MKNLRIALMAVILAATVSGCSLLYPNMGKPTDSPSPTATETETPEPTVTPTETETPEPTKDPATVEILDAYVDTQNGVLQVVAQITNFSEEGGTCTATFTNGSKSTSVSVKAESNAANTQCRTMEFPLGDLAKGAGVVSVKYDSTSHAGESAGSSVVIP
ncbi:MAG: hypothetical protein RIS19_188 [Actinomycetota bacterium]|jgi:hypothetical protein